MIVLFYPVNLLSKQTNKQKKYLHTMHFQMHLNFLSFIKQTFIYFRLIIYNYQFVFTSSQNIPFNLEEIYI